MDSIAMMLLTVPIFFPLIQLLNFDPIWFGILVVRVSEIGQITPPIGLNVYIMWLHRYAVQGEAKTSSNSPNNICPTQLAVNELQGVQETLIYPVQTHPLANNILELPSPQQTEYYCFCDARHSRSRSSHLWAASSL